MNSEFNTAPEGLKEITIEQWAQEGMFHYTLGEKELRQVFGATPQHQGFNLIMFDVPNFENKKLGYAVKRTYLNQKPVITFCRYGLDEDWETFRNRFAAQFAGDNS